MAVHLMRVSGDQSVPEHLQGEPPLWPAEVLDRHGLRELRPAEAAPDPRSTPPRRLRSTVYRAATLLIPDRVFRPGHEKTLDAINQVMRDNGLLDLDPPNPLNSIEDLDEPIAPYLDTLADLPRPAVLRALGGKPAPDAWAVLQQLRQAVLDGHFKGLDAEDVDRISVEHALRGAAYTPGPGSEPHTGVGDDGVASLRAGYGRRPVTFLGEPPVRPALRGGSRRRPVIAVVDTGHGSCAWFGTTSANKVLGQGEFIRTLGITQQLIKAQETHVAGLTRSGVLLQDYEEPLYTDGISQQLADATGHGTFIAGLIRQHAPGADVISIRALQPDNVAYESDVLLALYMLLAKQVRARTDQGCEADVVDVVSLSLGFYAEDHTDAERMRITEIVRKLTAEGVVVVAAAGNDSTARPFLPAALSALPARSWSGPKVIGCGALNPNGSVAWFSNTGDSVSFLEHGANLVSVFPDDVRGAGNPGGSVPAPSREGLDPDDYAGGFATWSGTSFSTPVVAATVANLLIDCAETNEDRWGLDRHEEASRLDRASEALARLKSMATNIPAKKMRRW